MAVQQTVAPWGVDSGPALLATAAQLLAQVSTGQALHRHRVKKDKSPPYTAGQTGSRRTVCG